MIEVFFARDKNYICLIKDNMRMPSIYLPYMLDCKNFVWTTDIK